jgi:GNAT superfamily N-acetyltransferase
VSTRTRDEGAYQVRHAAAADEAGWRQLWRSYCDFYGVTITPDVTNALWSRIMDYRTPIHALVAESAPGVPGRRQLIGFANYVLHAYTWGTEPICYLEDLFVVERARGGGAGSSLLDALIHTAKENGWPRVYWHTHELNEPARSLYAKFAPVDPFVRYVVKID